MERGMKRSLDDSVYDFNNNKKSKCLTIPTTTKSCLENLPNEIFIEVFEHLDFNDIYDGFFALNDRFENLLTSLNIPFQIDLFRISKCDFDLYNVNVVQRNKHRMKILRLSNPFTVDEVFSPVRLIFHLTQLEKLIFDGIHSKYLHNILKYLIDLPHLHSLILSPIDSISNPSVHLMEIFRLKQLKSCQFTYRMKGNEDDVLPIDFDEDEQSSIEYLMINGPVQSQSLQKFLVYLPKLRHLSIDSLLGSTSHSPIELKDLKSVCFNLLSIGFDQFKKLIKNFFGHIEVLRLSTSNDFSYSHAKEWEELISSSLPNLRVFDIQNSYNGILAQFSYLCTSGDFQSKFWQEKQCFFHHLEDCDEKSHRGGLYSTNPYRRKDLTFYWQRDYVLSRLTRNDDFKSVKHLKICGKQAVYYSTIFFPNVTELTVKDYARGYSGSMLNTLGRVLPLKQLKKLNIDCDDFPIDPLLYLLSLTPNVCSLKWNFQSIDYGQLKSIEQSETYRSLSKTNRIENLQIVHRCWFYEIQFLIHLFPRVKSLQTGVVRKEIVPISRCILTEMDHLVFFHITDILRTYLQRLNLLIKSENLLDDYLMKFIDQDIYLWW